MNCSICNNKIMPDKTNGKKVWDGSHNAEPVNNGRCCGSCNNKIVIPFRINLFMSSK